MLSLFTLVSALTLFVLFTLTVKPGTIKPNIILIVADDLGFSDLGAYGSEIATPNLDQLTRQGLQLTNYHSQTVCSPARAILLAGADNHINGLGASKGGISRAELKGKPGYDGELNGQAGTLAAQLKADGYRTYLSGKWHLGKAAHSSPGAQGFEKWWALMDGGGGHFHDKAPNFERSGAVNYRENSKPVGVLPEDFYSSTYLTSKLIDYIDSDGRQDQPFFAYLAYTAPHWPLHAPQQWIEQYQGKYRQGWHATAKQRLRRQQQTGLMDDRVSIESSNAKLQQKWLQMDDRQRAIEMRKMEVYAAMISAMDVEIGRLIGYLEDRDQLNNTIIVFVSDNGPEDNDIADLYNNRVWIPRTFDNRLNNLGLIGSYIWLGEQWAQVSATPLRLYKTYLSEGGMRVPAIIRLPNSDYKGRINDYISVKDIAPTLLDLAGVEPQDLEHKKAVKTGRVLTSLLQGKPAQSDQHSEGWEMFGNKAFYSGNWKLLRLEPPFNLVAEPNSGQIVNGKWQLYNLVDDPQESVDLADKHPERIRPMIEQWHRYAADNQVQALDRDYGYGRWDYSQQNETLDSH